MFSVWRITSNKFIKSAFNGEGARLFGGRWNSRGTPLIYTAESKSLAALEILVHLESPDLLQKLADTQAPVERKLSPADTGTAVKIAMDEKTFRFMLNEDAMATEKLAEGIRAFCADSGKLKQIISGMR